MSSNRHAILFGMEEDRRAIGTMDRFRQRLQDPQHELYGECVVGLWTIMEQGFGLPWIEGHALHYWLHYSSVKLRGWSSVQGRTRSCW